MVGCAPTMIKSVHAIIHSQDAEADRGFFRDVLGWPWVDAGGNWLIFALPPAELAVHPAGGAAEKHELYLMCENVAATAELRARGVEIARPVSEQDWGLITAIRLPGGGEVGLYEPRHATPLAGRPD
jgi:predicted enzyme related to lactoylglutathione lyase